MNYIEQIKGFWLANEEHSFLPADVALYFYLLEVNNNCCWKENFKRNNQKIIADLSLSYKTLHASRQKLQNCGLITFETKNGSPNVMYNLVHKRRGTGGGYGEVREEVEGEVTARLGVTKDKLNKTNNTIQEKGVDPKFGDPLFEIEELKDEIFGYHSTWIERVGMLNSLSPPEIEKWITEFFGMLIQRGSNPKSVKDFKNHFPDWLKIQLENRKKQGTPPPEKLSKTQQMLQNAQKLMRNEDE